MTSRRYRITGMHCASCGLLVDDTIEDIPGIASSSTDVRTGCTTVQVKPGAADEDRSIVTAVAALGYGCQPEP